tara:strand:- start:145 stop:663 length:519 start_codon:yes stop_codon:yes gene_type:complete
METLDVRACNFNDRYLVYSDGSLYMDKLDKVKSPATNGKNSPYLHYQIPHPEKGGKAKKFYVHRLVAEHFLPNPDNLRDVHHIDNNPKNNDVSNLAWLSHKDNCALIPKINPVDNIKKKENAYCYNADRGKKVFLYTGGFNGIPNCQKYFDTLEEAKEYRDFYFLIHHNEVA